MKGRIETSKVQRKFRTRQAERRKPAQSSASGDGIVRSATQGSADLGTILLVDDNEDDVFIVGRAFTRVGVANPLGRAGRRTSDSIPEWRRLYGDRQEFPVPVLSYST